MDDPYIRGHHALLNIGCPGYPKVDSMFSDLGLIELCRDGGDGRDGRYRMGGREDEEVLGMTSALLCRTTII